MVIGLLIGPSLMLMGAGGGAPGDCDNCKHYIPNEGYVVTHGISCYHNSTLCGYQQNCMSVPGYGSTCGEFLYCTGPGCNEIMPQ